MDNASGMFQTLAVAVLFIGALFALPWLTRWLQKRQAQLQSQSGTFSRVLSAVVVGPQQQRVVTVEVTIHEQRTILVLGVTGQSIQTLHVDVCDRVVNPVADFSQAMSQAHASAPPTSSVG